MLLLPLMVFLLYIHPPCKKKNSWLRL
ncbi:hypothetical protein TB2_043942 [Malus domestica]